jgi:hypothetical protein
MIRDSRNDDHHNAEGSVICSARRARPRRPTKPFYRGNETGLKPGSAPIASIKQRGAIMVAFIINLFYRQSCKTALCAIRKQQHIWA